MPYVYDFLIINQLVLEEIALQALQFITGMEMVLIEGQGDSVWEYSFVHSWGRPDSVGGGRFFSEIEYFKRAFAEKIDVKEYLPAEYFINKKRTIKTIWNEQKVKHDEPKTSRNEPCPCGSGKKYRSAAAGKGGFASGSSE